MRTQRERGFVQASVDLAEIGKPGADPTGMLRKAKAIAMIVPVPVSDTGGTLNARM